MTIEELVEAIGALPAIDLPAVTRALRARLDEPPAAAGVPVGAPLTPLYGGGAA